MSQRTANNHYLPQAYQRAWSDDGVRVPVYRLLVPSEREPLWKPSAIKSLGAEAHLYTSVSSGAEDDAFERWITAEIEEPALEVIEKVKRGQRRMTPQDYHRLAYFFAAMDLRTPAGYLAHAAFVDRTLPGILKNVLARLPERLQATGAAQGVGVVSEADVLPTEAPPTRITIKPASDGELAQLHVELTNGRELWLRSIRRQLRQTARVLTEHRWAILRPAEGAEWPTSDRPALRLNYHGEGRYDFDGGWGSRGTDLLLPLSPQHLLHTRIGYRDSQHGPVGAELTARIRRAIVDGALRWVVGREPADDIPRMRPREVNLERWTAELAALRNWHADQTAAEVGGAPPVASREAGDA